LIRAIADFFMNNSIQFLILLITTTYHFITTWQENKQQKAPGKLINIDGYKLHLYSKGQGKVTVIIDHSLGGLDGYFLIDEIAKVTRVCIYDRPGYGWSDSSPRSRCSEEIIQELNILLAKAEIEPPYILVGDSFGSYNMRLYAYSFPEQVIGLVLTDGLHEQAMLKMSFLLKALKLLFISGFIISAVASILGIIRILGNFGIFEFLKKELKPFSRETLQPVKRSFYSHRHWLTMTREMWNLDKSAAQVSRVKSLGDLPIVSIKANTFLRRTLLNFYMPLKAADRLRDKMHNEFLKLSTNVTQVNTRNSSHFVWVDEPQVIVTAIQNLLQQLK
jgi:pimeloyl-ACP methyl ester carboxylesterase